MKLAYPEIESVINFNKGTFPSLVIENPCLFYRFINELHCQSCGEDGSIVLSIDEKPILSKMEKQAMSQEFYERSQQILGNIEKLIYDLAFQNDLELEPERLSMSSLLKSTGIILKENYPDLAEKILVYMDLMSENGLASVFVFVNLRSFLDDTAIELFTESCCRKEHNILLVDNKVYKKLSREERLLIDNDLCEI